MRRHSVRILASVVAGTGIAALVITGALAAPFSDAAGNAKPRVTASASATPDGSHHQWKPIHTSTVPVQAAITPPTVASAGSAPAASKSPTAKKSWTVPKAAAPWQYQLSGTPATAAGSATVFDIDGAETSASTVATIIAGGGYTICYVSAGSWEDWRSDAASFPTAAIGKPLEGWDGENWLDIRKASVVSALESRVKNCAAKGFDGIEFDNVDGYTQDTGFALTATDQLTFNKKLAALAHKYGLSAGLKNDVEQISQLHSVFDFAVNESCLEYNECSAYAPFIASGKAVFHVEYRDDLNFCSNSTIRGFSSIAKDYDLRVPRKACQ